MLIEKPTGEIRIAYDHDNEPYLFEATGKEAKHFCDILRAEDDGRLVILPCKVGDTFYYIAGTLRGNEYVASDTVAAIELSDTEPWIIDSCGCHHIKFWFTREEAEAALKGETKDV